MWEPGQLDVGFEPGDFFNAPEARQPLAFGS